jgi:hypothetical protein
MDKIIENVDEIENDDNEITSNAIVPGHLYETFINHMNNFNIRFTFHSIRLNSGDWKVYLCGNKEKMENLLSGYEKVEPHGFVDTR